MTATKKNLTQWNWNQMMNFALCSRKRFTLSQRCGLLPEIPLFLLFALLAASILPGVAPLGAASRPEAVLYLIGDGGLAESGSPVMGQLRDDLLSLPAETPAVVAFLGDNIYPRGLRTEAPHYATDRGHLEAQIEVVRGSSAAAVFVPGNHDWDNSGKEGRARLAALEDYLAARAIEGPEATLLRPQGGCPGPETMRLGNAALLVFLDTHWWLHRHERSEEACAWGSEEKVIEELGSILRQTELPAIVLGHHPLETRGPHRGTFWRGVLHWFLPLNQDLPNPRYQKMRNALVELFQKFPQQPLLYAAGHDHSLQVFEGAPFGVAGLVLVSGAGSKLSKVKEDRSLLFAAGRSQGEMGYMKIEFFAAGSDYLKVFTDGTRQGGAAAARLRFETTLPSR